MHDASLNRFTEAAKKFNLIYNHNKRPFSNSTVDFLYNTLFEGTIKPDPERLRPLTEIPLHRDIISLSRALGMFSFYSLWKAKYSEKVTPTFKTIAFH